MKKSLIAFVLLSFILSGCTSTPTIIEDVVQFSQISTDELKTVMGEPISEESWTNITSKGDFKFTTLSYDKNSNRYEFVVADNQVIRLTINSEKFWHGTGNGFSYKGEKQDICKAFHVELDDSAEIVTENSSEFIMYPVNGKIDAFSIQAMDKDTYGYVVITYDANYYDL